MAITVDSYPKEIGRPSSGLRYACTKHSTGTTESTNSHSRIQHKTVTEYWPQANGQVERFNQVLEKHILTAQAEGKDWKLTIPIMLLNYRNTPHRMTGKTPSFLLMTGTSRPKFLA